MKYIKSILGASSLLLASYLGSAQTAVYYTAETTTEGVTLSNFSRSTVAPCDGTANWRTTQFRSGVTNVWRSPQTPLGPDGNANMLDIGFYYKVVVASGTGTWTISVDLYNNGTLMGNAGTVTGTGSTSGSGCKYTIQDKVFNPVVTVPMEIRITVTTTNTTITTSNYVQIDGIYCGWTLVGYPSADSAGLTQPSYTTGTRNISTSGSNKYGDVYATKSIQSTTICPGNPDPYGPEPICKKSSVPAYHEVRIVNKTTGDVTYGVLESFTIPYQTATYEKAYTNVQFEDATSYYKHYFSIPTVTSSGGALYWKTYEVTQP